MNNLIMTIVFNGGTRERASILEHLTDEQCRVEVSNNPQCRK